MDWWIWRRVKPAFAFIILPLLLMRKLSMEELGRKTVDEFKESDKLPVVVIMDNVRSMHNVGSIFRTADAFLLQGIYLCGYTPQPPHRDIQKTALGATETVAWKYFSHTAEAIGELRDMGYTILAIEQVAKSVSLEQLPVKEGEKVAIVMGNEVEGVAGDVLLLCDHAVEIPQFGMKHSLNVSVAAGIVLWELVRRQIIFQ